LALLAKNSKKGKPINLALKTKRYENSVVYIARVRNTSFKRYSSRMTWLSFASTNVIFKSSTVKIIIAKRRLACTRVRLFSSRIIYLAIIIYSRVAAVVSTPEELRRYVCTTVSYISYLTRRWPRLKTIYGWSLMENGIFI